MNTSDQILTIDPSAILKFAEHLSLEEKDFLKYKISLASLNDLENFFEVSSDFDKRDRFDKLLQLLIEIHPFKDRLKEYGLAYKGFPNFLTPELLNDLQNEAKHFRSSARINYQQYLSQLDTADGSTHGERLESSKILHDFVRQHAGSCLPSFVTSYIYYDKAGNCSRPHVDNAFTGITVMIGLEHTFKNQDEKSESIVYWPNTKPLKYNLEPGEMSIFFGTGMLHGRTPVGEDECVHSMLLSFRPCE